MHQAIILAGGLGTRLRSVVTEVPKPMAPVAGKPFLELLLRHLGRQGFGRVTLSVGYMHEKIKQHFGHRFEQMDILYEVEEQPLGTGGALRRALGRCTSPVFVFNGDTFLEMDIAAIWMLWQGTKQPTIVAREVPDASRYDVMEVSGDGRIERFIRRGMIAAGLVNAGCYVLPASLFGDYAGPERFSFEQDYLPQAFAAREFRALVATGRFIDIGVPADYAFAQTFLADLA